MREPNTVSLSPRPNRHQDPSCLADVGDLVAIGVLGLLLICIVIVIFAS